MSSNSTLAAEITNHTEVLQAGAVPKEGEKPYQVPISQEAINYMLIGKIVVYYKQTKYVNNNKKNSFKVL